MLARKLARDTDYRSPPQIAKSSAPRQPRRRLRQPPPGPTIPVMPRGWVAGPLVLVTAAVVAAGAGAYGAPAKRVETPQVNCETRIQVIPRHGPSVTREVRRSAVKIGGVYFIGAKAFGGGSLTKSYKTPYLIPTGPPVTVTILGRTSVARVDAEVGLDQAPYRVRGDAVTLTPCPPDAEVSGRRVGPYTVFNAGFRVDGQRCMRLQVQAESKPPTRGRIAFGRGTCG